MSARPRNRKTRPRTAQQAEVKPSVTREELTKLKVAELREMAAELEIDVKALKKKDEIIDAVLEAKVKSEGFVEVKGVLDLLPEGYGFLRTCGYLPGPDDVYVSMSTIRRNRLRRGDFIEGQVRPARETEKYGALHRLDAVNGQSPEEARDRPKFSALTPIYPEEHLVMERGQKEFTARTIDLMAPIGKGQRGLIVSPPKAGKTTILKDIAASISENNPEVHLMCLLVDERPEEVTDMERSVHGEVISSTFDMPSENHIAVSELVIERAKRLVETGADVVILLDSVTRLARAYNLATPASGRILSGGVDSGALYPPKKFFGAARNIEFGGSLTILATALVDTGSKMDDVIFEEFKGTGNMELVLDRSLADKRIFPAINVVASGTRKEELLLDKQWAPFIWGVRRIFHNVDPELAMQQLIRGFNQSETNEELLIKMAKKAEQSGGSLRASR
ncbi:MAG: transcription termination factor Rho [Coriobacteriia bacterium]|nr:transcription termination factor Rho [Coriobacteriia bacterium]